MEPGSISTDAPATIEVTVDIESDFELPKYEDFELIINPTELNDEDVDKEMLFVIKEHLLMKWIVKLPKATM